MTYIHPTDAQGALRRILTVIGDGFVFLAGAGTMARAVERLNAMSDADLAARGTTRPAEVQRIFGPRSLL